MARSTFDATADSSGGAAAAGLALFLLLVLSIPVATIYAGWAARQTLKASWDIKGPPCPVAASPPASPDGSRLRKAFDYGGIRFARRFGHVSCIAASEGDLLKPQIYRVCQFTGPGTISVTTEERKTVFEPGVGRTATVRVGGGGEPSCVMAGWFTTNPQARPAAGAEPRNHAPSAI